MKNTKVNKLRTKLKSHNIGKLRLCVDRSNLNFFAQIIDDAKGLTLVSVSTKETKDKAKTKTEQAAAAGAILAKLAMEKKITTVYFDRNVYKFHGRVKAFATAARDGGLKF